MQYILTDLPQYVPVTPRSNFTSSVVSSGAVLLFSEDGYTLTGKLPDGTFITIGGSGSGTDVSDTTAEAENVQSGYYFYNSAGVKTAGTLTVSGGGVDVSDTTATAAMVLSGYLFHDSTGTLTTGTIPTVSASITSGAVVVPSGYIPASQSFPVSSGTVVSDTTANSGTVLSGYVFHDSTGAVTTGTIPIDLPPAKEEGGNAITISAGYYSVTSRYVVGAMPPTGDASDSDILSGKSATIYGGQVISGTIPTISGGTITPTTSDQVISAGNYLGGSQTILGDAALVASNIVYGVSIFGVSGTAQTGSGGVDFYKCASVTSGGSTWSGYKAVLSSGVYSFESSVTSGLTYSVIQPQQDRIYSADALIEAASIYTGIPGDYIVYHPLSGSVSTVNGCSCTYSDVTFEQDSALGEIVAVFNGDGRLTISSVSAYTAVAFSIFQKIEQSTGTNQQVVLREAFGILSTPSDAGVFSYNGGLELAKQFNNAGWHHIYCDYENSVTRLFIDGILAATDTSYSYQYNQGFNRTSDLQMGVHLNGSSFPLIGRLKAFRMYNRRLNDAEIAALAAEFPHSAS